uniref:Dynein regulatory complex subunit 3 n=1 Tax=Sphenodon punctatus TaxID=8508 RepID=A0A8D0GGM6_SPHPU
MSRLYDTIEPNVIDAEMLQKAIEEQGPQEEAGQLAKEEGIDFKDVKELQLDFRNILKIDNLWQFVNLTKLQLDNNIIEKIEALDNLIHLIWLDLSFNNIEVIEGLDALVKLQDLSLYNNRISKIENLDTLLELQVFSIGNNDISALENIVYIRKFKHLRTLNLTGNPVHENEQYSMFIAAHLPDLVYLDFRLVDENTRELALIKYQYVIDELKQGEAQALAKLEAEEAEQAELEHHKAAYIEYLNGPFLFESMYAEDPEAAKLAYLPGMFLDSGPTYKSKFVSVCENLFDYGLKQHEKRQDEVAVFNECLEEALTDNREQGAKIILAFEEKNEGLAQYNEDIDQLLDTLMTLEMQMVDQLEVRQRESSGVSAGQFQCRDLENHHHEKLLETAINTLEKIGKSEFDEEMPDDVRMLFVDKDTIVNAVNASHDIHLLKIDNREDDIITKSNSWSSAVIEEVHKNEIRRNRNRVREINQYIDRLQEDLDNMETMEQMESPR